MPHIKNEFTGGMMQDANPLFQDNSVVCESVNGRIVYNDNNTYAWENAKGTTAIFNLPQDYIPLCGIEIFNHLIIFSTNNTNSEIGFATESVYGTFEYTAAFNDMFDPNGDTLNFSTRHPIKASVNLEDNENISVYWDDDYNEPRVFNILAGAAFGYANPYPSWYSVHSMASMMDFNTSIPQYVQTNEQNGTLPQGQFQYCYRLIHQNGYVTPCSAPCNLIMLAEDYVDGSNWTNYQMGVSGVQTTKSMDILINGIDTRFQRIQIIAIYWETPTAPTSAKIVVDTTVIAEIQQFNVSAYDGEAFSIDEITQTFTDITRAKTNEIFKSHLHRANAHLREKFAMDATGIEIFPAIRYMLSDTKGESTSLPFTHDNPSVADSVNTIMYEKADGTLSYVTHDITNEYYNYKGTQWEHLFRGEFRGETVPFGIVLWDKKGQPMFVAHIADMVMPNQYGDLGTGHTSFQLKKITGTTTDTHYYNLSNDVAAGSLTKLNSGVETFSPSQAVSVGTPVTNNRTVQSGEIPLKILGKVFNNIDLTEYLYDANGDLQLSGFSIVRMPRYVGILFQGALTGIYNDGSHDQELPTGVAYQGETIVDFRQIIHSPDPCFTGGGINLTNGTNLQVLGTAYSQYTTATVYNTTGGCLQDYYKNYLNSYLTTNTGATMFYGTTGMATNTYWTHATGEMFSSPPTITQVVQSTNMYNSSQQTLSHQYAVVVGSALQDAVVRSNWFETFKGVTPMVNWLVNNGAPAINTATLDNRVYRNIGHFVPLNAQTIADCTQLNSRVVFNGVEVWGGDCILDYWMFDRLLPYVNVANNFAQGLSVPIESTYNFQMQYGNEYAKVGTREAVTPANPMWDNGYYIDTSGYVIEPFNINDVLLAMDNWRLFYPLKSTTQLRTDYPITDFYSQLKVNGEQIDSFRRFLVNDFGDVDGVQGEINMLFTQFADLYFLQTNGLGRMRFDDRAMIATSVGQLATSTGAGFQGYDYINKAIGLQHTFGFTKGNNRAYWVDAAKGKLCRFSQDGLSLLSDEFGMHNFFTDTLKNYWLMPPTIQYQNPEGPGLVTWGNTDYISAEYANIDDPTKVGGITIAYDFTNDSVLVAFTPVVYYLTYVNGDGDIFHTNYTAYAGTYTVEFNEKINRFTGWFNYFPNMFMAFKRQVISNSTLLVQGQQDARMWLYNNGLRNIFYGVEYPSNFSFYVKSGDDYVTYFDNGRVELDTTDITKMDYVTIYSPLAGYQQTIALDGTDNRVIFKEGVLRYPMMELGTRQRFREKYVKVTLFLKAAMNNTVIRIASHLTNIRTSPKE